jgi:hypothetical protein
LNTYRRTAMSVHLEAYDLLDHCGNRDVNFPGSNTGGAQDVFGTYAAHRHRASQHRTHTAFSNNMEGKNLLSGGFPYIENLLLAWGCYTFLSCIYAQITDEIDSVTEAP